MEIVPMWPIVKANKNAGLHFFDPGTLRWFRSRLARQGYKSDDGRVFFVTSEQFSRDSRRCYTVRVATPDGKVDTVGEFQGHASRSVADRAARKAANRI